MIFISIPAQKYFLKLLSKEKPGTQIRVFIKDLGSESSEGKVCFCAEDDFSKEDSIFYYNGFSVYIKKIYLPFLKDSEINLLVDNFESQLTFKIPNIKNKLSELYSLEQRIEDFIETKINIQLSSHGGRVSLVEINLDNYVILKFSGGCNGCSMVSTTLKEGIEKQLLSEFSEIKGVKDITDHIRGIHSYF